MLNTSGCAFSISSNKSTLYGFLRTFSESCPPSSYPTYPGGEPINLDTLCFSIYSDISTRIMACSLPNTASASALDSSVLPTPVGPRNRKEPMGRLGSFSPTRPLFTAWDTAATASSCPITLLWSSFSRRARRLLSPSVSFCTGIFVHWDTISATVFSSTNSCFLLAAFCAFSFRFSKEASSSFCCFWISPAFPRSPAFTASSFSWINSCICLCISSSSGAV